MDRLQLLEPNPRTSPEVSVIPIPLDLCSDSEDGLDSGPQYLFDLGLVETLNAGGVRARVLPEVQASKRQLGIQIGEKNEIPPNLLDVFARTREAIGREIAGGKKVLAVGGDHAIAIGSIAAASTALDGNLGVIWIDVHGDLHTHETTVTWNIHGMAASAIMGHGEKALLQGIDVPVAHEHFLAIGHRDLEKGELDFIRTHDLSTVTMFEIAEQGLAPARAAIDSLRSKVDNIWISLDIDSIDMNVAPASAMATEGGFTHREITNLITYIGKTSNVIGLDIVELAPPKDVGDKTGVLAIELAAAAFGSIRSWYRNYIDTYEAANQAYLEMRAENGAEDTGQPARKQRA